MYLPDTATPPAMAAEPFAAPKYDIASALYNASTLQVATPQAATVETTSDQFYEGMMNPMYNFDSPYMARETPPNNTREHAGNTYIQGNDGNETLNPWVRNDLLGAGRFAYGMREMEHSPASKHPEYPYTADFRLYSAPGYGYAAAGRTPFNQQDVKTPKLTHPTEAQPTPESSLNTTHTQDCQKGIDAGCTSTHTDGSTPSVTSDGSPILHPETLQAPVDKFNYLGETQMDLNAENDNHTSPIVYRHGYNAKCYNYNVPAQSDGNIYNAAYLDSSSQGLQKPMPTWSNGYASYMVIPGYSTGKEVSMRRDGVQTRSYSVPATPYAGNVVYGVSNSPMKSQGYDSDVQQSYCCIPEGPGYYASGPEFPSMKREEFMSSTIRSVGRSTDESIHTPQQFCSIQQGYDSGYMQSPRYGAYYCPQLAGGVGRQSSVPDYEDSSIEMNDTNAAAVCLENLKNINRSEIDFVRMSDSVWQTLRSTGMFKLGNKGRAILKSKISKHLKHNPKLRIQALSISGVRRATTRQLFQLAQICGIKSHLK